jgi:outer membrane protein OmpA-like peptidoglycan-associated protein
MLTAIAAVALMGQADAPVSCPGGAAVPAGQTCPLNDPFILFFDWNSAAVSADSAQILDRAALIFRRFDGYRIDLAGSADRSGSEDANMRLSRRRVEAVRDHLIARGVPREAFRRSDAFGENRLLVETEDGVRERQNRFVTVGFVPAGR